MSFDRGGKAAANERKYPFIVEVHVAANGLDAELNRQIVGFHKSRRIPPRFGRTVFRDAQTYYHYCFSDVETARAFVEQFGLALELRSRDSFRRRQEHTRDQNAERDVVETVRENVHRVVPAMHKIAR